MRTILSFAAAIAATMWLMPTDARASHDSPLSQAACAYRDAVVHFGHEVIADHRLTHFERRVAPPLVHAANRFYVIAQHPHHSYLLRNAWLEIGQMHQRVQAVLFSHPGCPVYVALYPCWQEVLCAYHELAAQLALIGCHTHGHRHVTHYPQPDHGYPDGVHLPGPSLPQANQQSYRYRDAIVPSYRYGNYGHSVVPPLSQSTNSLSERRMSEGQQQIDRVISRRQLEMGKIGATLSRRID